MEQQGKNGISYEKRFCSIMHLVQSNAFGSITFCCLNCASRHKHTGGDANARKEDRSLTRSIVQNSFSNARFNGSLKPSMNNTLQVDLSNYSSLFIIFG